MSYVSKYVTYQQNIVAFDVEIYRTFCYLSNTTGMTHLKIVGQRLSVYFVLHF
jgi:hypothetical protein